MARKTRRINALRRTRNASNRPRFRSRFHVSLLAPTRSTLSPRTVGILLNFLDARSTFWVTATAVDHSDEQKTEADHAD